LNSGELRAVGTVSLSFLDCRRITNLAVERSAVDFLQLACGGGGAKKKLAFAMLCFALSETTERKFSQIPSAAIGPQNNQTTDRRRTCLPWMPYNLWIHTTLEV
jgi:hypothetical protein